MLDSSCSVLLPLLEPQPTDSSGVVAVLKFLCSDAYSLSVELVDQQRQALEGAAIAEASAEAAPQQAAEDSGEGEEEAEAEAEEDKDDVVGVAEGMDVALPVVVGQVAAVITHGAMRQVTVGLRGRCSEGEGRRVSRRAFATEEKNWCLECFRRSEH